MQQTIVRVICAVGQSGQMGLKGHLPGKVIDHRSTRLTSLDSSKSHEATCWPQGPKLSPAFQRLRNRIATSSSCARAWARRNCSSLCRPHRLYWRRSVCLGCLCAVCQPLGYHALALRRSRRPLVRPSMAYTPVLGGAGPALAGDGNGGAAAGRLRQTVCFRAKAKFARTPVWGRKAVIALTRSEHFPQCVAANATLAHSRRLPGIHCSKRR
jgi:hypothetical protein